MNTHGVTLAFGRHRGELVTRVPVSYLQFMVNTGTQQSDVAAEELKRRGTVTPDLDVSGHAIDRASLHCRKVWHETRGKDEGLHAWLVRMARAALDRGDVDDQGRHHLREHGLRFVFADLEVWPVLKTITRTKRVEEAET